MILGKRSNIQDFREFIAALNKSARGVTCMLRTEKREFFCTGWQITDNLVIIPEYALGTDDINSTHLICSFDCGEYGIKEIPASVVRTSKSADATGGIALLRLSQDHPGALSLCAFDELEFARDIYVLLYTPDEKSIRISAGNLTGRDDLSIYYDADTLGGSGGAPVLNNKAQVIGMHTTGKREGNGGLSLQGLINQLKPMPEWSEIAAFHRLADTTRTPEVFDLSAKKTDNTLHPIVKYAALKWHIDPSLLTNEEKTQLKPYVSDANPKKWVMKMEDRQRIIQSANSLEKLRKWHHDTGNTAADPGEKVIHDILKGPPYNISQLPESELPYWLQAVRWFGDLIPGLPGPPAINLALEQKKIRSRLTLVAGPEFQGREKELKLMRDWYLSKDRAPLMIVGIGGIGKSALISKFLLEQPGETTFYWLDFDRADLAPDDADSVLTMIDQQAYLQIAGYQKITWEDGQWEANALQLGKAIRAAMQTGQPAPLMVLDGFEVAQYVKRYNEIWQVLEQLGKELPQLKLIVSGRAPVRSLQINKKAARVLELKGLDKKSAERWLAENDITNSKITDSIFRISMGIPLAMKLAVSLIKQGGNLDDLPDNLQEAMVDGYLYQRILDRVIDPLLQPLAKDMLVLRKVNADILQALFADAIPEETPAADIFERLTREMSLINEFDPNAGIETTPTEEAEMLHLRPEVRSATLRLLEQDNPERVKAINEKAAKWYMDSDLSEAGNRAELIYHQLQLGNLAKAAAEWNENCVPYLSEAANDFGEKKTDAAKWLSAQLQGSKTVHQKAETIFAQATINDIVDNIHRGRETNTREILKKAEGSRAADSPLIIYDALQCIKERQIQDAVFQLQSAAYKPDTKLQEQKLLLLSLAHLYRGDKFIADTYLEGLDKSITFQREAGLDIKHLLIRSARLHIHSDLESELALLYHLRENSKLSEEVFRMLIPSDIMLSDLSNLFDARRIKSEAFTGLIRVPYYEDELAEFRKYLISRNNSEILRPGPNEDLQNPAWKERILSGIRNMTTQATNAEQIIFDLIVSGVIRRELATKDLFLAAAAEVAMSKGHISDQIKMAITSGLAPLSEESLLFERHELISTDAITATMLRRNDSPLYLSRAGEELLTKLRSGAAYSGYIAPVLKEMSTPSQEPLTEVFPAGRNIEQGFKGEDASILLLLLGPHPLEVLCRQALELPHYYSFKSTSSNV